MPRETWDVTIQKNRPKGEPHATTDTITYRVSAHNPAEARRMAGKRADKKWSSWTIIAQDRR